MTRLLTLMTLMILGALAVRTQDPSPYFTNDKPNGLSWRTASLEERAYYVAGAKDGYLDGAVGVLVTLIAQRQPDECIRTVDATAPVWLKASNITTGAVVKEMRLVLPGRDQHLPTYAECVCLE
jgi:hypothetical protein